MSKRFKGGTCAYCGDGGKTADHVFARGFFPRDRREGIPQVASCESCNRAKSQLEHYLLTVLPFGNRHPASGAMLEEFVPRRLARNVKLHLELAAGRIPVRLVEEGVALDTGAVPFDSAKMYSYFRYVARGLATAHFGRVIPSTYAVSAGLLTKGQDAIMRSLFVKNSSDYARGNLGDGLVLYEGQQALDDPDLTIWRFLLYGGMVFGGDERWPADVCPDIWAVTAKQSMSGLADS